MSAGRLRPRADLSGTAVLAALGLAMFVPAIAHAVPRFSARYEQKCTLCHMNPSGGGLRTLYASQYIVPEELAWSKPAPKILESINPLIAGRILIGTDFRTMYSYASNAAASPVNDFFQMQGDLYLDFQMDDQLSLYYDRGMSSSYELFGLWQGLPLTGYVKLGRFVPAYGWKFDDHTMFVRNDLGFAPPGNSDVGVELGASPGRFDIQLAAVNGNRGSTSDSDRRLASVFNGAYRFHLGEFGLSAGAAGYWENREGISYGTGGTFGYATWRRLTWTGQVDFTRVHVSGEPHVTGFVTSNELSVVLHQGLELLATYDFLDPDYNLKTGSKTRWGGGVYVMPRPFLTVEGLVRSTRYERGVDVAGPDFWEGVLLFHLLY
jgi:hypothetical protein